MLSDLNFTIGTRPGTLRALRVHVPKQCRKTQEPKLTVCFVHISYALLLADSSHMINYPVHGSHIL